MYQRRQCHWILSCEEAGTRSQSAMISHRFSAWIWIEKRAAPLPAHWSYVSPAPTHRLLTSGFLWSRWRDKRSRHSRRMRNPQFYVSGKRPMVNWTLGTSLGEISRVSIKKTRIKIIWNIGHFVNASRRWYVPVQYSIVFTAYNQIYVTINIMMDYEYHNGFFGRACKCCNLYESGDVLLVPIAVYGWPLFTQGKPQ